MNLGGTRFETDKTEGKVLGVCAGIANAAGVDATVVRIGFVLMAVLSAFSLALVAYCVLAYVGRPRGRRAYAPVRSAPRASPRSETRERMRDLDRRMQEIETYVTSSNSDLAREIEELR